MGGSQQQGVFVCDNISGFFRCIWLVDWSVPVGSSVPLGCPLSVAYLIAVALSLHQGQLALFVHKA